MEKPTCDGCWTCRRRMPCCGWFTPIDLVWNEPHRELQDDISGIGEAAMSSQFIWDASTCQSRVFQQFLDIFTDERKKSFAFFSNTNDVEIAKVARPRATRRPSNAEPFVLVDVDETRERIYHPLNVRRPSRQDDTGLEVRMLWGKHRHWKPIRQWLSERYGGVSRKRACICLYWKFTGKTFNLMQLPQELRDRIFDALMGPVIWPRVKSGTTWRPWAFATPDFDEYRLVHQELDQPGGSTGGDPLSWDLETAETSKEIDVYVGEDNPAKQDSPVTRWHRRFGINKPDPPRWTGETEPWKSLPGLVSEEEAGVRRLLSVSRAMCDSLQNAIARTPTAMFNRISDLTDVICQTKAMPSQASSLVSLRRVTLVMPIVSQFRLFGYGSTRRIGSPAKRKPKTRYLEYLTKNSQLEILEFIFHIPGLELRQGDRYDTGVPMVAVERQDAVKDTCQKILIDWFFTLLYVRLLEIYWTPKKVPRVKFWGHVKNSTQRKWETKWADLAHGKREDFSGEVASIKPVLDAEFPPRCVCSQECDLDNPRSLRWGENLRTHFDYEG